MTFEVARIEITYTVDDEGHTYVEVLWPEEDLGLMERLGILEMAKAMAIGDEVDDDD